ncbi:MAG TPA: PilZ domain-containing protein [Terriglobales bacterium]|nr:PilZ domain-containing protein [Terriglobales bacterium]
MFFKRPFAHDRRRRKRQLLSTSVHVFTESGRIDALGINISDVGMCLFTVAHLPVDSQIQVELLPPGYTERVRILGTVRHRALYLYGVEFVDAEEQSEFQREIEVLDGLS